MTPHAGGDPNRYMRTSFLSGALFQAAGCCVVCLNAFVTGESLSVTAAAISPCQHSS